MLHLILLTTQITLYEVYSTDTIRKGQQIVVQLQYRFPTTKKQANSSLSKTENVYKYQTFVLSIDEYTKNVGHVNGTLRDLIKQVYGTNFTDFSNNADGIGVRLLYPFPVNLTYYFTDLSSTQCEQTNTQSFTKSTGEYIYCENLELSAQEFRTVDLTKRTCKNVVTKYQAWNQNMATDMKNVANMISTRWVSIFSRNGSIYQAEQLSFIITLKKGNVTLEEQKVCWSVADQLKAKMTDQILNRYQILQSPNIIPDFRLQCSNPGLTNTEYRCIQQGNNESIRGTNIQINNNQTNTTNSAFPNNIKQFSIYIGWQGTDSNGQALTSERNSFYYLNSYSSAL